MFLLGSKELGGTLLGCGDGPAAFNADLSRRGGFVVSADPIYRYAAGAIQRRIDATAGTILAGVKANRDRYCWDRIATPEALLETRLAAMETFLRDFAAGHGRYVAGALPCLPFPDGRFDLALCSHLLFTYSEHLDAQFHRAAAVELLRVAPEVRIFPVLTLAGERSPHVALVVEAMTALGHQASIEEVPYAFQRGGNQMLRLRHGG